MFLNNNCLDHVQPAVGRGLQVLQRAGSPGGQEGRQGGHLYAHDNRARRRNARLRQVRPEKYFYFFNTVLLAC